MVEKIYYNYNGNDINLFLNFLRKIFLNFYISPNADLSFFAVSQPHFFESYSSSYLFSHLLFTLQLMAGCLCSPTSIPLFHQKPFSHCYQWLPMGYIPPPPNVALCLLIPLCIIGQCWGVIHTWYFSLCSYLLLISFPGSPSPCHPLNADASEFFFYILHGSHATSLLFFLLVTPMSTASVHISPLTSGL